MKVAIGKLDKRRVVVVCGLCLLTALLMHNLGESRPVPLARPLDDFPAKVGDWQGGPNQPLPASVLEVLGVDGYVSRDYILPDKGRVNFYASFFTSTQGTKSYHSPRNCMPGSGWNVDTLKKVPLSMAGLKPLTVSRMIMEKGSDHLVALYWYQGRGRVMATEYTERIYRVLDSLLHQRTDGAFIRIIADAPRGRIPDAEKLVTDFARTVIPELNRFLPQ